MGLWGVYEFIAVGDEGGGFFYECAWRVFFFFFFFFFISSISSSLRNGNKGDDTAYLYHNLPPKSNQHAIHRLGLNWNCQILSSITRTIHSDLKQRKGFPHREWKRPCALLLAGPSMYSSRKKRTSIPRPTTATITASAVGCKQGEAAADRRVLVGRLFCLQLESPLPPSFPFFGVNLAEHSAAGESDSSFSGSAIKPPASKPGSSLGGSSPSKPKSPALAPPPPPKAPKVPSLPKPPKLPKPNPGWKPPKGSIPGSKPGHAPYHGSGGHGDHGYDDDRASSTRFCIHPEGMDRLRCEKADAVVGTLFAIIAFFLVPFLFYLSVRKYKRRKGKRKNRHEEDGLELTSGVMNCDPGERTDRGGLAESPDQEDLKSAKEEREDRSAGDELGQKPPPAYQLRTSSGSPRSRSSRSRSSRNVSPSGSQRSESQQSERPGSGSQKNESPKSRSPRSENQESETPRRVSRSESRSLRGSEQVRDTTM